MIYQVLDDIYLSVLEVNGSLWSYHRKECVKWTCIRVKDLGFSHHPIYQKLNDLVHTWDPAFNVAASMTIG